MNVVDVHKRINELAEERGLSPYVTAFRENDGYRKKQRKGGEKSERRLEIML